MEHAATGQAITTVPLSFTLSPSRQVPPSIGTLSGAVSVAHSEGDGTDKGMDVLDKQARKFLTPVLSRLEKSFGSVCTYVLFTRNATTTILEKRMANNFWARKLIWEANDVSTELINCTY